MKLYNYFTFVILLFIIVGCSSSSDTSKINEKVDSQNLIPKNIISKDIEITIPYNWSEIKDNNNSIFDIWLINSEATAVISFIPISLSSELNLTDITLKLNIIEDLLISKKKSGSNDFSLLQDEILASNYQMKSIRYLIDDQYQNSILFGDEEKYYECLAYFHTDYKPTSEEIEELFETQKQIVTEVILK